MTNVLASMTDARFRFQRIMFPATRNSYRYSSSHFPRDKKMFVRTRSADKLEGAYGLKQDSNGRSASMSMNGDGKKHQAEKDTTGDPSAFFFSEFSAAQSTYKWQYERNDKRNTQLRVEAIAIIESVITKQNERKSIMTVRIKSMVDMGRARLGGSNKRGMYSANAKSYITFSSNISLSSPTNPYHSIHT